MINLAIIGGGPAGLSAGLYATRGGLSDVVLFDKGMPGGQIMTSSEIENYPGVSSVLSGIDFMQPWKEQCFRFGLVHNMSEVIRVSKNGDNFNILLSDGSIIGSRAVIICTGGSAKKSNIKGESEFWGKGVSVCATCDGFFYKGKEVAVLGGGDTALEEAAYLTRMCKKVYIIHRRNEFRAAPVTVKRVLNNDKIEIITPSIIEEIYGDDSSGVTGISIKNLITNEKQLLSLPGVFIFVGYDVNTSVLIQEDGKMLCDVNEYNQIMVDLEMKTSIKGLFSAGDVRDKAYKQVVIAAGDGATAALSAIEYLQSK